MMTDTNHYYYQRLSAEEISAHVTNILRGFEDRNVHPLDQRLILLGALQLTVTPS